MTINHGSKFYRERFEIEIGEYIVIVDKRADYDKKLYEELKYEEGSLMTHIGRVKRKDNNPFYIKDIGNILNNIEYLSMFMSGRHMSIFNITGYIENKKVYEMWQDKKVTPFKKIQTCTGAMNYSDDFQQYLYLMFNILNDKYIERVLKHCIEWYIEICGYTIIENRIISVQIALESLSYVVLVEGDILKESKKISKSVFKSKKASEKIRMLLDTCNVKYGIKIINEILKFSIDDGPHIITDFRNIIVYPSKKDNYSSMDTKGLWSILQIETRYLDLVMLFIIGYEGYYTNRLESRWFGETDSTVWEVYKNNQSYNSVSFLNT
ncbi:hypothetical protein LEQ06_04245 [Paraclostridium sp. AKS46]|nr:hypothetical protein [Paraclostridium sp. AKS46]